MSWAQSYRPRERQSEEEEELAILPKIDLRQVDPSQDRGMEGYIRITSRSEVHSLFQRLFLTNTGLHVRIEPYWYSEWLGHRAFTVSRQPLPALDDEYLSDFLS